MANDAPSPLAPTGKAEFSLGTLAQTVLASISRQLAAVVPADGGGRSLHPVSIRFRVALTTAPEEAAKGDGAASAERRFHLASPQEQADTVARVTWQISAPDTASINVEPAIPQDP
ncbi:MAG: hypothetical protein AAF560_16195 [Acidobacteriota bacterium]